MIYWGSTELAVLAGTWSPSQTASSITEIELLPDPSDLTAVSTILQQSGRKRRRVSGNLKLSSMTDYNDLLNDMDYGNSQTLDDNDTVNGTYYIESLEAPNYQFEGYITAQITFVEG